jgi:hypothetical protein
MKQKLLFVFTVGILSLGVYKTGQILKVPGFNINNTAAVYQPVPPNCQSQFQIDSINNEITRINTKLSNLPNEIASTTKVLKANKILLDKAIVVENAAKKLQTSNELKLTTLKTKLEGINSAIATTTNATKLKTLKAQVVTVEKQIKAADTVVTKSLTALNTATSKREALEKIEQTLRPILNSLNSGDTERSLLRELDVNNNPTTGKLVLMKKKPACPSKEANGGSSELKCHDLVDNDMNGLLDCADTTCSRDNNCIARNTFNGETGVYEKELNFVSALCHDGIDNNGNNLIDCADNDCRNELMCKNLVGVGTGGNGTGGNDNNSDSGSGTCSDPQYTTQSACRNAVQYTCDIGGYTDQYVCENNGGTWAPNGNSPVWTPDEGNNGNNVCNGGTIDEYVGDSGVPCVNEMLCRNTTNSSTTDECAKRGWGSELQKFIDDNPLPCNKGICVSGWQSVYADPANMGSEYLCVEQVPKSGQARGTVSCHDGNGGRKNEHLR